MLTSRNFYLLSMGLVLFFVGLGCSSSPPPKNFEPPAYDDVFVPSGIYSDILTKWTQSTKAYADGREAFSVTATLVAPEIAEMQIYQNAKDSHLTSEQYRDDRDKLLYKEESSTTCFVSFYTPTDDENDLDKSHSVWNVFMNVGGKRVLPTSIKRTYEIPDALKKRYPYVNVWARSYYLTFALPAREVAIGNPELTIAGILGSANLKFQKK